MTRAVFALLLLSSAIYAQDNHYWTHQFGTRSALLGGAVVGGDNDTSAAYYNPARLGWITNDSLKVSADGYQFSVLTIADGAGTGLELSSVRGDIVPLTASGVYLFKQPRIGLGFHILSRQYFNARASARVERLANVIDDARSPGDEDFIGSFQFTTNTEEYWAGLGFGWAITDWLGIGITHFGALRFEDRDVNLTTRAVGSGGETYGADDLAGWGYFNVRMLWKAGVAVDLGALKMGVTVTTPSLNLFGSATVYRQVTVDDLDILGNGTGLDLEANDRREGVSTRFRSPLSIASGVEYDFGPILFALAWEWYLPVGRYKAIAPEGDKAFLRGVANSVSSRRLLTVYDGRRGAFNVALSCEGRFSPEWSGYWSMRRDAAADYLHGDDDLHFGVTTWDLFHLATGISFMTRQDNGSPKHELMVGLQIAVGSGRTDQPVNFDSPREELLLTSPVKQVDVAYFSISLLVGYTYHF